MRNSEITRRFERRNLLINLSVLIILLSQLLTHCVPSETVPLQYTAPNTAHSARSAAHRTLRTTTSQSKEWPHGQVWSMTNGISDEQHRAHEKVEKWMAASKSSRDSGLLLAPASNDFSKPVSHQTGFDQAGFDPNPFWL